MENLYDVLPPAIWNTHYGVDNAPYQAFFKSSYYETVVDHVLSSIAIGAPVRLNPDEELHTPGIVCALKPNTVIVHEGGQVYDIYDICKRNPTWTILYYPQTLTIFICTVFFLMPPLPAVGNCPTVNETTNQFDGNLAASIQSQMYMLLHEIAHFYIGATVEDTMDEVMDWNYAFSLSGLNATVNALNYVLYVASKCYLLRLIDLPNIYITYIADIPNPGIDKDCQNFPHANQSPHPNGRRLGAIIDLLNASSAGENYESQGLESRPGRGSPFHSDVMNMTLARNNSTFPI